MLKELTFNDLKAKIILGKNSSKPVNLLLELVENPSPEIICQASVKLINKLIFDSIQEVQKQTGGRTSDQIFEYIKTLDKELDFHMEMAYKIKDRDFRKEIMQEIQECKEKTYSIVEILRQTSGRVSNVQIAQLNDMAYKVVRTKKGFQKKLDERAMKNQSLYKKLEGQVKNYVKGLNYTELREQNADLINQLGSCPLSCFDLIEAMQAGDCMCLCLDVGRSQAAIADPSRLVVKDIIPTFMTSDSFLDSALFSLKKDQDAHGGYKVSNEGKLAMGLGRENITGVLPLYLTKEHWEVAKRKVQPVFGFLCTLDIMGYASSQYFTIPYIVLQRCMSKVEEMKGSEAFKNIEAMVLATCVNIMKSHEEFRKNTILQLKNFAQSSQARTLDVVPSIQVMLMQLYCLTKLENYE